MDGYSMPVEEHADSVFSMDADTMRITKGHTYWYVIKSR